MNTNTASSARVALSRLRDSESNRLGQMEHDSRNPKYQISNQMNDDGTRCEFGSHCYHPDPLGSNISSCCKTKDLSQRTNE